MRGLKYMILGAAAGCLTLALPVAESQVAISVGAAPDCPYGYYDAAPYGCAPSGYYGPEWFSGGLFIGAGPWFNGSPEFRGNVNNAYHSDHGYRGPYPGQGERADESRRVNAGNFHGNEQRDGRGHAMAGEHSDHR